MPSKLQARDVVSLDRETQALELKRKRKNYRQIAEALGVSIGTAYGLVQRAYGRAIEANKDEAEQQRREDLARIEIALDALDNAVMRGDVKSIEAMLKALELKAKLWGYLKAPQLQLPDGGNGGDLNAVVVTELRQRIYTRLTGGGAPIDVTARTPELPGDGD